MGFIGIGLLLLGMMVAGIVLGKRYEFSRGFPLVASAASLVSIGAVYLVPEFWGKALLLGAVMCFWFATLFSSLYLFAVDPVSFARLRAQVLRNCPEKRRRMSRADRQELRERLDMLNELRVLQEQLNTADLGLRHSIASGEFDSKEARRSSYLH